MTKVIREQIIGQLACGEYISGESLGKTLGVSRAAINKHIKSLDELGIDVFRVHGKGYKLAEPLDLLNKETIRGHLANLGHANIVEVHSLIDSTNSYLMRRLPHNNKHGQVCIAEYQNSGRGRRGRKWISPFGSHIYLSMYWYLEQGMSAAMGLSLVTALAVSDALKLLYDLDVQLKWPNDVYLDGVKLAGILIELEGQALEPCHSIIGVGLNLAMPQNSAKEVGQPWTDLQAHTSISIDRNKLSATLIACLTRRLNMHSETGLTAMVVQWHKQDHFLDKKVRLITGEKETHGICRGINNQGALLLEVDGQTKAIYGGEVSLRSAL
jgi:BirA family biotin operon repressor/biotin-[acetyl-CoA-carboxylase] ligase